MLDQLLAERGHLRPGEAVTVLAPLAADLAARHSRGTAHGAVSATAVRIHATGRPALLDPPRSTGNARPEADVEALARLGAGLLGPHPPQTLVEVLHEAGQGRLDAAAFSAALLAACRAEPVRLPPRLRPAQPTPAPPVPGPALPARPKPARAAAGARQVRLANPVRVRRPPRWPRALLLLAAPVALALAVAVGVGLSRLPGSGAADRPSVRPPRAETAPAQASTPAPPVWRQVVARLDQRRADAYSAGDPAALAGVYLPGSAALASDTAALRAYRREGVRVRGLRLRLAGVHVLARRAGRVVLRVTDRMAGYRLVDGSGQVVRREPGRGPATWRVTLRRDEGGRWRIAAVGHLG